MEFDRNYWDESIASLKKSRNYLQKRVELDPAYGDLIEKLNSRIASLDNNLKPVVKLVDLSDRITIDWQKMGESDSTLRSLYDFDFCSQPNITRIIDRCNIIFVFYASHRQINPHQRKLLDVANRKKIVVFPVVIRSEACNFTGSAIEWFEDRECWAIDPKNILFDRFFEPSCPQQIATYKQVLLNLAPEIQQQYIRQYRQETITEIRYFFNQNTVDNWQKIKQIKQKYLQDREVRYYQQHILNKTFNRISKRQQQKILFIKQKINQSRNDRLNIFMPDSWLFQLQQTIDRSEIKLVTEDKQTYLYCTIENNNSDEYLHSYILGWYQQQVVDILKTQWHDIRYCYADGGFDSFIQYARQELAAVNLLEISDWESLNSDNNLEILPQLELSDFIDARCLKINSRIVFDYSYIQSSWFKLSISVAIGTAIYLITKLYFGTGKYIGFFILIFQLINIITGQSIKSLKLKQHKKELQRIVSQKYQALLRTIVERSINTLIASLDRQNQQYQQEFDRLAQLAQTQLDAIEQDIQQLKSRKNRLESDRQKIISWFD